MNNKVYDLEERTLNYSKKLIQFIKTFEIRFFNQNVIRQLLKSGTSIGANYREANGAESKQDFRHKIAICKKESKETQYWLELLFICNPEKLENGKSILQETNEFVLIFTRIHKSSKSSS